MAKINSSNSGLNWANLYTSEDEPKTRSCYDPSGVAITLDEAHEKASGGEGVVYTVPDKPHFLVKIYKKDSLENKTKAAELRKRIETMAGMKALAARRDLAWPIMPVYSDAKAQHLIGFAMRACKGEPIASLFGGPASVERKFPGWNRRDLAKAAMSFLQLVDDLAQQGVFVNDFNPANFLVDKSGHVSFIDTDSYQVSTRSGAPLLSHTHFPSHAAPELLEHPELLKRPRTIEQVRFSAAIIAFQILMCGYHPYSFYDAQNGGACGTPDENLRNGQCPLGCGATCRLPENWYKLWSFLTGKLKNLFITTFREGHDDPSARPDFGSFIFALNGFVQECVRLPERLDLRPKKAKPHDLPISKPPRPNYPQAGFLNRRQGPFSPTYPPSYPPPYQQPYGYETRAPRGNPYGQPTGCRPKRKPGNYSAPYNPYQF